MRFPDYYVISMALFVDGADQWCTDPSTSDGLGDGGQVGGGLLHPPYLPRPAGAEMYPSLGPWAKSQDRQTTVSV